MGQVKLQIRNLRGDKICVARSMKTSSRGAVMKFETVDATIHVEIDGKPESISKRCIDVNTEMIRAMGVSKAIINDVLFCHQEESNWPLDESKKLKEKFDAIFGTTEYNKAIEKIIKFRKLNDGKVKTKGNTFSYHSKFNLLILYHSSVVIEHDLKLLLHIKKEAESKTIEMQNVNDKLSKLEMKYKKCQDDMAPLQERLDIIRGIEMNLSKLKAQEIELSTK